MADPQLAFLELMNLVVRAEYDDMTQKEVAEYLGVDPKTVREWKKRIDWGHVLKERRKIYGEHTAKVDRALLRAAQKEDVQAIRTWYERFDDFIPRQERHNKTERIYRDIPQEELEARLAEARKRRGVNGTGR